MRERCCSWSARLLHLVCFVHYMFAHDSLYHCRGTTPHHSSACDSSAHVCHIHAHTDLSQEQGQKQANLGADVTRQTSHLGTAFINNTLQHLGLGSSSNANTRKDLGIAPFVPGPKPLIPPGPLQSARYMQPPASSSLLNHNLAVTSNCASAGVSGPAPPHRSLLATTALPSASPGMCTLPLEKLNRVDSSHNDLSVAGTVGTSFGAPFLVAPSGAPALPMPPLWLYVMTWLWRFLGAILWRRACVCAPHEVQPPPPSRARVHPGHALKDV